jgi:hypothetical protein
MKRAALAVLIALVAATAGWGQYQQFIFQAPPPSMVGGIQATVIGARANTTLYYWVTARYPIGVTMPAGPGRAVGGQAIAGLGMANYNRISWGAVSGATGYDVIRTTTPQFPTNGTCLNCVVASNTAAVTFNDVGGGVVNWPTAGTLAARAATAPAVLNNRDANYPFLQFTGELHLAPQRSTLAYSYLFEINDHGGTTTGQMTGGAAQKTYAFAVLVNRPTTAVATGDSNDAIFRGSYNNYAVNDANFIMRGVNTITNNRTGGALGILEGGLISTANRGTSPTVRGLSVGVENYGITATELGGIDVNLRNEGAVPILEYGVKVRNTNNSLATAVESAYLVADTGANIGFNVGLNLAGATIQQADVRLSGLAEILSGAGVPGGGLCTAANLGAIYLNHGGGGGTSLYVCEVAGAWAGK